MGICVHCSMPYRLRGELQSAVPPAEPFDHIDCISVQTHFGRMTGSSLETHQQVVLPAETKYKEATWCDAPTACLRFERFRRVIQSITTNSRHRAGCPIAVAYLHTLVSTRTRNPLARRISDTYCSPCVEHNHRLPRRQDYAVLPACKAFEIDHVTRLRTDAFGLIL